MNPTILSKSKEDVECVLFRFVLFHSLCCMSSRIERSSSFMTRLNQSFSCSFLSLSVSPIFSPPSLAGSLSVRKLRAK